MVDHVKTSNGRFVGFALKAVVGKLKARPLYAPDPAALGCTLPSGQRLEADPIPIYSKSRMIVDGADKLPSRRDDSGPAFQGGSFINDAAQAPTSFEIGEVKFGGTPNARTVARDQ